VSFICPEIDTLLINGPLAWSTLFNSHGSITQVAPQLKGGLSSIRSLGFTALPWSVFLNVPLEEIRWNIWVMLPRFEGMRNVKFLLSRPGDLEPCKEALVAFLELGKGRFKDGIVPEVTVVEAGGSRITSLGRG
jgi:hypothetical protein